MTAIATGVYKQLVAKIQTGLGVKATASGAQLYRRVQSTLDAKKQTYQSKEIRPSMQRADFRHGIKSVDGTISGELSLGTYQAFMASVLRAAFSTAASVSGLTDIVAAVTTGAAGTFTTTAGDFIAGGLKVGMVIRATGFTTTATANNAHNCLITGLTTKVITGVMLDGVAFSAKTETGSVTFTEVGKHCAIPQSGHTRDYWTIEHNFSDITQSEQFTDCVFGDMNVKLPATGMATVDFPITGLGMDTSTSAYFTTPAAASSGAILAAVNGAVYVAGVPVGNITSLEFSVKGNLSSPDGVVGSNVKPDVFRGSFDVTGQMTVLFADATLRDAFIAETEVAIIAVLTAGSTATAGFQVHNFPRVKLGGASKDDGEKGLTLTVPFTALENTAGGTGTNTIATSYWIQDSAAV